MKNKSGFIYRYSRNKLAVVALFVFVALVLSIFTYAWFIADFEQDIVAQNNVQRLLAPSAEHLMGTDEYGRDIFLRILYGGQYSLFIGVVSVAVALVLAIFLGSVAGYFGGIVDNVIMRLMDVFLALPLMLMAMVVVAALGAGMSSLIWAMALASTPDYARQVRVALLSIRGEEYIEAARAVGTPKWRIVLEHMLPNVIGPIIVRATLSVASTIMTAASMSYLGIGIQPPLPEWGAMLSSSKRFLTTDPLLALWPCLAIVVTVLCINLIGDGVRDAIDPKLRD